MKTQLKKAFFGHLKDQRDALEAMAKDSPIIRNIQHPGDIYEWVLAVGGFLLMNDVITPNDLDLGRALVEDYTDRFTTLFPEQ